MPARHGADIARSRCGTAQTRAGRAARDAVGGLGTAPTGISREQTAAARASNSIAAGALRMRVSPRRRARLPHTVALYAPRRLPLASARPSHDAHAQQRCVQVIGGARHGVRAVRRGVT